MTIKLYKEDYKDSGWFELLKQVGHIKPEVEYEEILDTSGEIIDKYKADFADDACLDIETNKVVLHS